MTDTNKRQSIRLQEKWIEQFKPLIDKADHHLVDDYYACFSDDVWGALDHYLESKNNNNVSSPLVHLSSAVAQSNEPISSQHQSDDSMGKDTSDNQQEAPSVDVAMHGFTTASVVHYFENNDSSNSSFAANNITTSTNAQSNNRLPPTVAAASSKQPPSKSVLSPRKRAADDEAPSSRPSKNSIPRAPSSSLLSPDGISGFITSTPTTNQSKPIGDNQQSNLEIPSSASLPNVPSAQQTSKGLMSRRLYIPLNDLDDLPEYKGGNDELLRNLHGYDEDKAAKLLKKLLGEKGGAMSFDQLKHVANAASTTSINIDTNALDDSAMQRVVMTDDLREKMNKTLDDLDIHYNESTPCEVDGCVTPACTSRKAEKSSPLFSIPFSHCMAHALQLSAETGEEFVYKPCRNEHGVERYGSENNYYFSFCSTCLSNKECKIPGCKEGGNGNTNAKNGLCRNHLNQQLRKLVFMKRDVQNCRRCGESLEGHLVPGNPGGKANICDRTDCKDKCVYVVATSPDGEEEFCSNGRVQGCYCTEHYKQQKRKAQKETWERRANGELTKQWTEAETNCLIRVTENPQYSKKKGKGSMLVWDDVEKAVRDEFEANDIDRNKFTLEQMKAKNKHIAKKREKNAESVPVNNLPWYKCLECIAKKGEEKTRARQKSSPNAESLYCLLKLDGCGKEGSIKSMWREVPPPNEN